MRITLKFIVLIALLSMGLLLVPQISQAKTVVPYPQGHHSNNYGHNSGHYSHYGHYPYYGNRGYYGGYPYWGWGVGWGWGYPYYGFGYYGAYPASPYAYGYGYGYGPYGQIRTEVKPQSAQIFVDGGYVGKADDYDGWWQRLQLEPGQHRIVFRAPGFKPYVTDIRIVPGADIHLKYGMQAGNDSIAEQDMMLPRREYSRRDYGQGPEYGQRPDGRDQQYERHQPQEDRYQDQSQDQDQEENIQPYFGGGQGNDRDMYRRPLILHIEPSDATVYVDGNYYGTANDNGRSELQLLLPEGRHRIEVVRPGFDSFSQDVTVGREQDNHVNIVLQKK